VVYGAPNLNTNFVIGSPGYFVPYAGAGQGGAGGGGGGGGGASKGIYSANGASGSPGEDGGDGGEPGKGAPGGGGIYIKAGKYDIPYSGPVFFADGGQGDFGRSGKFGGAGGTGGFGGQGYCHNGTFYKSGGNGADGKSGIGATGGDGANGGKPGTIWLVERAGYSYNLYPDHFSVKGGKGGRGGLGQYPAAYTSNCSKNPREDLTACDPNLYNTCAPNPPCNDVHECNCDSAYKYFSLVEDVPFDNTAHNRYEFDDASSRMTAYYNYDKIKLVGIKYTACETYYYHCNLKDTNNCNTIFGQLYEQEVNSAIDFPYADGNHLFVDGVGTSSFEVSVVGDNANMSEKNIYYTYLSSNGYIKANFHTSGNLKCYNSSCDPTSANAPVEDYKGEPGVDGNKAPDGTVSTNDPSANVPLDPTGMVGWKRDPSAIHDFDIDQLGLAIFPSPVVGHHLTLKLASGLQEGDKLSVALVDISGKRLVNQRFDALSADNEVRLDVRQLPAGTYLVHATVANKTSVKQVLIH
jgi:hypothetical protein